jgi:hypothetical protein
LCQQHEKQINHIAADDVPSVLNVEPALTEMEANNGNAGKERKQVENSDSEEDEDDGRLFDVEVVYGINQSSEYLQSKRERKIILLPLLRD